MFETKTYDDPMVLNPEIRARWAFLETSSAAAVLQSVCPEEWADITSVLQSFYLDPRKWLKRGGNRGPVAIEIDGMFATRKWREIRVDLRTQGLLVNKKGEVVEQLPIVEQEGYLVDNFKGRVALDVEWNAKDGNLDRDLSAYRAWHDAGVIAAAVIITQDKTSLKALAERLWADYLATLPKESRNQKLPRDSTSTTTNLGKVTLRIRRGAMGTCPLLVVAAVPETWNGQPYKP